MGKLYVSIFSFDSRIDFQNGSVRQEIHYESHTTLKDIFQAVDTKNFGYQEFGIDLQFLYCRINGRAVFGNLPVKEIVAVVGNNWEIDPLSKRFAKKDLLLDFDSMFAAYSDFFYTMDFIAPSDQQELKKYLLINFIAPHYEDSYCGDGFLLYVKWLLSRYPLYKAKLLHYIAGKEGGIFEHISSANFMLPYNRAVDEQIESLQAMILDSSYNKEWRFLQTHIASQYHFTCNNRIADYQVASDVPFIQSILHGRNEIS